MEQALIEVLKQYGYSEVVISVIDPVNSFNCQVIIKGAKQPK